jgi:hypothetical protein
MHTQTAYPPLPCFRAGRLLATPSALAACEPAYLSACLARHVRGDWGVVCTEDREQNAVALRDGLRLLSAYPIDPTKPAEGHGDNCVWIITEADRSVTTILLPDEY